MDKWKLILILNHRHYLQYDACEGDSLILASYPVTQTLLRVCVCVFVIQRVWVLHTSPGYMDVVTHQTLIANRFLDLKHSQKS